VSISCEQRRYLLPNARPELLPEAGARYEWTLEAVSSRPLFGQNSASRCRVNAKSVHTRLGHSGTATEPVLVALLQSKCTNVVWFDLVQPQLVFPGANCWTMSFRLFSPKEGSGGFSNHGNTLNNGFCDENHSLARTWWFILSIALGCLVAQVRHDGHI
jgi:hypothetical protein